MSITDLEYTHPADDIAGSVTPTLSSGSQATGYTPEKLYNGDPSYPFKVDSTTFRLVWDFVTAKAPQLVVLVHPNFAPGLLGVKWEMNISDSWGSPAYSKEFPAASYHDDDFPANLHVDLRTDAPSYRYGSLVVTSANSVNCSIGEVIIATQIRALDGHVLLDSEDDESHPIVEHKTDVGVTTIYQFGTRLRWLRGDVIQESDTATQIRTWNRATQGRAQPFVLLPHLDGDEAWFVRFEKTSLPRKYFSLDLMSRYRLEFEEVSRGLAPTPSAV